MTAVVGAGVVVVTDDHGRRAAGSVGARLAGGAGVAVVAAAAIDGRAVAAGDGVARIGGAGVAVAAVDRGAWGADQLEAEVPGGARVTIAAVDADGRVDALPRGGVAAVAAAGVVVVAVLGLRSLAGAVLADVAQGAAVAVGARGAGRRRVGAADGRVAAIGAARVLVGAVDRHADAQAGRARRVGRARAAVVAVRTVVGQVRATRRGVTVVDRAGVAVVAGQRVARSAGALGAGVVRGAGVAVEARFAVRDRVRDADARPLETARDATGLHGDVGALLIAQAAAGPDALSRVAVVVGGAGQAVVALALVVDLHLAALGGVAAGAGARVAVVAALRGALTRPANAAVVDGTGVSIIARRRRVRARSAASRRAAGVDGAGVVVVAAERRARSAEARAARI